MEHEDNTNNVTYWKTKYQECEKKLSTLRPLAADGITAYDDLLKKYESNQLQYKKIQEELKTKDEQLASLKDILEPVYNEYDALQTKYDIETTCRAEVEDYASKITKENKELRRQSQAILQHAGGSVPPLKVDVPLEEETDSYQEHTQRVNIQIKGLEEELAVAHRKVRDSEEEAVALKLQAEKTTLRLQKVNRELEQTKAALKKHEFALKDLANCSEEAYNEYQALRKKYDIEMKCRTKAEQYASQMYVKTEAMRRQSAVLLGSVAGDERLMKALVAVEEANTQLEDLKEKHSAEVKSLKEELNEAKQGEATVILEAEIKRLEADNQTSLQKIDDFNSQYEELMKKYKALEDRYEVATRPPPPPPPPVLENFTKTKKNVSEIIKERREMAQNKLAQSGVKSNASYAKAIDEMMNRIKGGRPVLKPTNAVLRRPSVPDETESAPGGKAMEELHNIFQKLKRTQSEGDLVDGGRSPAQNGDSSELARTFQRVRGGAPQKSPKNVPLSPNKLSLVAEARESQTSIGGQ